MLGGESFYKALDREFISNSEGVTRYIDLPALKTIMLGYESLAGSNNITCSIDLVGKKLSVA